MKALTAEETLTYLIYHVTTYVRQLQAADGKNQNAFVHGEKTAYVEALEMIQLWQDAEKYGLDYDIEQRFPI